MMDDPIQMDDLGYIPQGICPQKPGNFGVCGFHWPEVQFSQNRTQRILRLKKGKQKWQGMQVLSMIQSRAPFFWQVFFWDSKRA